MSHSVIVSQYGLHRTSRAVPKSHIFGCSTVLNFDYSCLIFTSSVAVRLSNGRGMHEGRVEVYHGGVWGTVCSVGWDFSDGEVVCRELGFPGVRQVYTSLRAPRFGEGSGLVWLEKAGCEGNETSLSSCRNPGWANHRCTHVEDAGVLCKGELCMGECSGCIVNRDIQHLVTIL